MSRQTPRLLELHPSDKKFLYYRALDICESYSHISDIKDYLKELESFMSPVAYDFLVDCIRSHLKLMKFRQKQSSNEF